MAFRDDGTKIARTSFGLIAGTGFIPLLDAVNRRLTSETVSHTGQVVAIAREERHRIETTYEHRDAPDVVKGLASTGWLFTYFAPSEEPTSRRLRLDVCHAAHSHELLRIEENRSIVLMPTGTSEEQAEGVSEEVQKLVKPLTDLPALESNFQYHAAVASTVIQVVAKMNDMVSPRFQVGVQTLGGHSGISPLADCDRAWSLTLEPDVP